VGLHHVEISLVGGRRDGLNPLPEGLLHSIWKTGGGVGIRSETGEGIGPGG
jgi:hypothetical protein